MKTANLILMLIAVNPFFAHAAESVDYRSGMRLGQGYDLVNGESKNNDCIRPLSKETQKYKGVDTNLQYEENIASETLRRFLEINASAAYKGVTSGADAKMEFVTSSASNSSTSSVAFKHYVRATEISSDSWDYQTVAKERSSSPGTFKANCGTHYIRAIVEGGEFYGTVSQVIKSEEDRSRFSMVASASMSSAKADLSSVTELEKSSFASTVKIRARKAGGADTLEIDMPTLRKMVLDFRTEVAAGKTIPVKVELAEYPASDVTVKSMALQEAANLLLRYIDTEKQLDAIETDPSSFYLNENVSTDVVAQIRTHLRNNKNKLVSAMNECREANSRTEKKMCDLSKVSIAYPPLTNQIAKLYKSTCGSVYQPKPLENGVFAALPRTAGDDSMGGQDVAFVGIKYDGAVAGVIKRTINLSIVETRNDTQFTRSSEDIVWPETGPGLSNGACTLKSALSLPPKTVGAPFPIDGNGHTSINNFMDLYFSPSDYLVSATCRSNQQGGDDGYVGCTVFRFHPITVDFQHAELSAAPAPLLKVPDWLARPASPSAYLKELHDTKQF